MFKPFSPNYALLNKRFRYYFNRRFKIKYPDLVEYEDQIVILAVFLFISSSLMFKTRRHKYFDFEWQSYLGIYKTEIMEVLSLCAIRFFIDSEGFDVKIKEKIEDEMPKLKEDFMEQYKESFLEKYRKKREIDSEIDIQKYPPLLNLVLKIHNLYEYQIPKDNSKIQELVDLVTLWKEAAFNLFRFKSEYILFSFLVNLIK